MTIDLLYVVHNRLDYVRASLGTLAAHTNWERINRLIVIDDDSTDGTTDFIVTALPNLDLPVRRTLIQGVFGGPVAAFNRALDTSDADILAKIDSDVIVCPDWLDHMAGVLEREKRYDAIGMEPGFASPVAPLDVPRGARPARWIGGVGLIRTRLFARHRPVQTERFFGWTQFQRRYANVCWVDPDLPVFLLDHLPFEPWRSLAADYVEQGWQREWPDKYTDDMAPYWSWWAPDQSAKMGEASGNSPPPTPTHGGSGA